ILTSVLGAFAKASALISPVATVVSAIKGLLWTEPQATVQRCLNVPGSYICVCDKPGYELASDGFTCTATMWCETDVCDQECTETADGKSFTCHCREGYTLREDGTTCGGCSINFYGENCALPCNCTGSSGMCDKLKRVRVVITVTGIVVPENDLTDVNSSTHSFWRQSAVQATDGGFDNPALNLPPVGDGEYYSLTDYDKTHPYAKLAPK
ncbi:hypothetical protein BaRGS_00040293, partial [Batillaria attramentaria]